MRFIKILVFPLIVLLLFGCSRIRKTNNDNLDEIIAYINGEAITMEDVITEVTLSSISAERVELLKWFNENLNPNSISSYSTLESLENLGRDINNLRPEEKRAVDRDNRRYNKSKNEAFNEIIRKKALYNEALNLGFKSSDDEIRELLNNLQGLSNPFEGTPNEKLYREFIKRDDKILKNHGFKNREDFNDVVINTAIEQMSNSKLHQSFIEQIRLYNKDLNFLSFDFIVIQNAWEDYTEHLLRKSNIEILTNEFEIIFYGVDWQEGYLNLSDEWFK